MDFKKFSTAVHHKYNELSKNNVLYRTNVPKEILWDTYLGKYTGKDAEIFRERAIHDCQTCKSFIRRLGNVVSVTDGVIDSIWNVSGLSENYQAVADAMHKLVVEASISGLFIVNETLAGKEYNIEQTETGEIIWHHFHADISKFYKADSSSINSEVESTVSVFIRALNEIDVSTLDTVLDLCGTIYKGEEHISTVSKFRDAKIKYDSLDSKDKNTFAWSQYSKYPSKIRNSAIGNLILDIQAGKDIELAVKSFETIVAPQNYKRTTAVVTPAMKNDALKTIEELGIENSLYRRFAVIEDISVNDVIYADRNAKKSMKDSGIKGILDSVVKEKLPKNSSEISIEDFINSVVPSADKIEINPENRHLNNLCSIIAPKFTDAPNILKWDNNFSWAYKGGFTDSLKENVKSAGGNVDGVLRFSIQWNDGVSNPNDLDAHCISPKSHIYYGYKRGVCGGELDVDIIHPQGVAVENIFWKKLPPVGDYVFEIVTFSDRGGSDFKAQIEYNGEIFDYSYNGRTNKTFKIATVTHHGNGKFSIKHHMESSQSSKKVDGVTSLEFNTVSSIMLSPNYWGDNKVGHKHYMFMIDGARNDEKIRGLYNEFLKEDLNKHRKVFDVLGANMICEEVPTQLTGLGFSSTVRNDVMVRVTKGDSKQIYKIKF